MEKCNGRDNNRLPLYKVVPLIVPFSVGLAVSDFCNFRCVYCKHSTILEKSQHDRMLSWDEFVNMANEIESLCIRGGQKVKVVTICGTGEPLTHKMLPQMIRYIKEHNWAERIELTTNGSLLTHDLSDQLIEAGLTRLIVSVQGINTKTYRDVCGYDIDYPRFINELKYFYTHKKKCFVYIKTVDIALKKGEQGKFYDMFSPFADMVNIESVIDVFDDVDYSKITVTDNKSRYGYAYDERKCCHDIFMRLHIETDGSVGVCSCKNPALHIGNINKQRLIDIWNGDLHRKYMKLHLMGRKNEIPRCASCDAFAKTGHPLDNLDQHADEILQRLV